MTIYCGVDFHARQQTIAFCDTVDGEIYLRELDHQSDDVRNFYSRLKGEVIIGLEPMEYSSGDKQRFGSINKGGSRFLRYLLVEAAKTTIRRDEDSRGSTFGFSASAARRRQRWRWQESF